MAKRSGAGQVDTLTAVLRTAIRTSGFPLHKLADRTGVSTSQLSRFLKGERTVTLPVAERLMAYFRLRVVAEDEPAPG